MEHIIYFNICVPFFLFIQLHVAIIWICGVFEQRDPGLLSVCRHGPIKCTRNSTPNGRPRRGQSLFSAFSAILFTVKVFRIAVVKIIIRYAYTARRKKEVVKSGKQCISELIQSIIFNWKEGFLRCRCLISFQGKTGN